MRNFVQIDRTNFPFVIVTYQNFVPTMEEFLAMQADIENTCNELSDFVLIVDLSIMPFQPSEFRIMQAKWQKKCDPLFVRQKCRIAFCIPSIVAQMMLKGVFLINKPAVPHTVTSSVEKGIEWGRSVLSKAMS